MNKIKKLEKKAELIQCINIKENINDLDSIDDFININPENIILLNENGKEIKAKLVKSIKDNAFYKKSSGEYYRFNIKNESKISPKIIEWANKLKNYVDYNNKSLLNDLNYLKEENKAINKEINKEIINLKLKIKELDKLFKDGLEQTNELTDMKINNLDKRRKYDR